MVICSRSSIQNINNKRLWIRKNKCIIEFNKQSTRHQYLINNHYDDPKAFMEYANDMQDVYKNIEEYNLGKKRKLLIVF